MQPTFDWLCKGAFVAMMINQAPLITSHHSSPYQLQPLNWLRLKTCLQPDNHRSAGLCNHWRASTCTMCALFFRIKLLTFQRLMSDIHSHVATLTGYSTTCEKDQITGGGAWVAKLKQIYEIHVDFQTQATLIPYRQTLQHCSPKNE